MSLIDVLSNVPVIKTIAVSGTLFGSFVVLGLWAKALPKKWNDQIYSMGSYDQTENVGPTLLILLAGYVLVVGGIEWYFVAMKAPYNAFHCGMMLFAWLFFTAMAWLGSQSHEEDEPTAA